MTQDRAGWKALVFHGNTMHFYTGAPRFLPPVVIGHSNDGMLAMPHVVSHPDTPAMILLSAHGGDGVVRTSRAGLMAWDRLEEITEQAHAPVEAGHGR